ncbi:Beige protein-like 1 [Thecaphora frezii]
MESNRPAQATRQPQPSDTAQTTASTSTSASTSTPSPSPSLPPSALLSPDPLSYGASNAGAADPGPSTALNRSPSQSSLSAEAAPIVTHYPTYKSPRLGGRNKLSESPSPSRSPAALDSRDLAGQGCSPAPLPSSSTPSSLPPGDAAAYGSPSGAVPTIPSLAIGNDRYWTGGGSAAIGGWSPRTHPSPLLSLSPARIAERDELLSVMEALNRCDADDLTSKLHLGGHLHRLLVESSHGSNSRDDFREEGGFVVVIQLLSSLESTSPQHRHRRALSLAAEGHRPASDSTEDSMPDSKEEADAKDDGDDDDHHQALAKADEEDPEMRERLRVEIFKLGLSILSEAMLHHPLNAKTFNETVGWEHLSSSIKLSTIGQTSPEHLFGSLLGLCLADVSTYSGRVASLRRELESQATSSTATTAMGDRDAAIEAKVLEQWSAPVVYPNAALLVLEMHETFVRSDPLLSSMIGCILERMATSSKRNQVLLAEADIASRLLQLLLSQNGGGSGGGGGADLSRARYMRVVRHLFAIGIPDADGRRILRNLVDSGVPLEENTLLDLLLDVSPLSREPNSINFSMADYGHASVAFATLRRPFPPGTDSKGFSFVTSFCIDRFEPSLPLELLHIFDAHRTSSVQLTIEPGTGLLTYSTLNQPPPIRFKAFRFLPGRLYHISFTHARPKGGAKTSMAQLFVDGVLVEERLAPWPPQPPNLGSPVRAVLGSPPNARARMSGESSAPGRINRLVWSLGPAWLLDDLLAPDLPLVLCELGSRYSCNVQDSLGRFLTYRASARINLRLDAVARGSMHGAAGAEKEIARHPLVMAIAGKASDLVNEERLYFVLNAANTVQLDRLPRRSPSEGGSADVSHRSSTTVILNQALPMTREAISASFGFAKLYGDPVLLTPRGTDELLWKLGGCSVLLKLIDLSTTSVALRKTLSLFFDLVSSSWRLSEDVERSKGYEVLGSLLRSKVRIIDQTILGLLLAVVGVDYASPEESVLVNPFLYRIILLDFDLWSQTSEEMQLIHLDHFKIMLRTSKHRRFNVKRVSKMQIPKKMVYALRTHAYTKSAAESLVSALRAALTSSFTDAAVRIVTSYLATELCKGPEAPLAKTPAARRSNTYIDAIGIDNGADAAGRRAINGDRPQGVDPTTPLMAFEMLTELVIEKPAFLHKFAEAINIKWLLLFFHPRAERRAVVLALELLVKLLNRPKLGYAERFTAAGGFKVMERLLPRFWSTPMTMSLLWSALFGMESAPMPALIPTFLPSSEEGLERPIFCPPVMRTILSCAKEALRSIAIRGDEPKRRAQFQKGRPSDLLEPPSSAIDKPRHQRKRSQSMNVDVKDLQEAFKTSNELVVLRDTLELVRAHATASHIFREMLFAPLVLRCLIDAIFPFIGTNQSGFVSAGGGKASSSVVDLCSPMLDLLARLAVDSMVATRSTAIVAALTNAIPPTDLAQQAVFRTSLYADITVHLGAAIEEVPDQAREASEALAEFIEKASEDILKGSPLEGSLYGIIVRLLKLHDGRPGPAQPRATSLLLLSLNRILLHRLTLEDRILETFTEITEAQSLVFLDANRDPTFFECLQNRVLHHLSNGNQGVQQLAFNILKLMTLSRPAVVEGILADGKTAPDLLGANVSTVDQMLRVEAAHGDEATLPYQESWDGFFKSGETLKAAAHLERVQQLHEMLKRVDTREQAVINTESRMVAWHASLCEAEQARYAKFVNDAREMSNFAAAEWRSLLAGLERERALFGPDNNERDTLWKLDATEGPARIRLKMQQLPLQEKETDEAPYRPVSYLGEEALPSSPVEMSHGDEWNSADAGALPPNEVESAFVKRERDFNPDAQPVTAERSVVASATAASSASLGDEAAADNGESYHEDKYRRVLRSLERGDIIEAVFNTSRVVGIESRGCLLILGKTSIYLMDDYFQRPNGELINVWEAPPEERDTLVMATLSSDASRPSGLIAQLEGDAQTRKWPWSAVQICHRRSWLHRRTAVEIFFEDGQSCLLVCRQTVTAQKLYQELRLRAPSAVSAAEAMREGIREGVSAAANHSISLGSRLAGAVLGRSQQCGSLTSAWQQGKISNFAYLMELNTLAGRSMNDLTQFPCFPWILADYSSAELDVTDPATFRKFELPMGAQTPQRRREFEERFGQLVEVDMEPFHYGTHYSTAATVCGFLIRTRPFERLLMALQGGNFDLADRTFSSIGKAWTSASELSRGDVRELIPEFFYLPEFLTNSNRFNFGITQAGEVIDDVELPQWAKGDPRLFIQKHREALECDYVSQRLHTWIDLIFGYRSRGQEAIESTNVFHPLSYEDAVDLDSIESSMERQAAAQVIHNFGQTPSRLFFQPHPQKLRSEVASLPVGERFGILEHPLLLIQSVVPIRSLKNAVHFIYPHHPEKAFASPRDYLILPHLGVSLSLGHLDGSIRMFGSRDAKRPIAVTEQLTADRVTCIAQARSKSFIVGSADGTVSVWNIDTANREVTLANVLRGHDKSVLCVAASSAWSIAVSGSNDRTAIVWDLNRGIYVRSLRGHDAPVQHVAIDNKGGYIATAFGPGVRLWSINGDLLASLATSANILEPVSSLAFYERDYHVGHLAVVLTGHRGKMVAWKAVFDESKSGEAASKHQATASTSSNSLAVKDAAAAEVDGGDARGSGRSKSHVTAGASRGSKIGWRLENFHVFPHHHHHHQQDRSGQGLLPPFITSISSTHRMLLTGDELGRLFLWTLAGEAVAIPDSYSAHCMNSTCSKRFGVLESRRACGGCGGLFCNGCAAHHRQFSTSLRFCPSCHAVIDAAPYF